MNKLQRFFHKHKWIDYDGMPKSMFIRVYRRLSFPVYQKCSKCGEKRIHPNNEGYVTMKDLGN